MSVRGSAHLPTTDSIMRQNPTSICVVLFAACLYACPAPAVAAKYYRWIDDQGRVHYTDQIPPDQVQHGRARLDERGLTVETVAPARTAEEIRRELELARLREEKEKLIEQQREEDLVLMRTFQTEEDIILARNGRMAAIDVIIKIARNANNRNKQRLAELQKTAADLERLGKPVPHPLIGEIEATRQNLKQGYEKILQQEASRSAVQAKYDADAERFRFLKRPAGSKGSMEDAPRPAEKTPADFPNVFPCVTEQACDRAWTRAADYVERHSTTPLRFSSPQIVMASPPKTDEDISVTIVRIPDHANDRNVLFLDVQCRDSPLGNELCETEATREVVASFRSAMAGNGRERR